MLDPVEAYDRLGPFYETIAANRRPYLEAVDRLVIAEIPNGSRAMLDVGSGDGRRANKIAKAANIEHLVLIEPSVHMQGGNGASAKFRTMRAEQLHSIDGNFDVITCLWNVLGHIFPARSRLEVLRQFARLASAEGRIFLDVQHRYNARHYGAVPSALRFLRDQIRWSETNGDAEVAWNIEGSRCTTRGHVFTHREFRLLASAAGLDIEKRFVVDYSTGELRRWSFEGHLFYLLRPPASRNARTTS